MNRQEFLSRLEILLRGLPAEEKKEALDYYENYFEDAGEVKEQAVIEELESPEKVAANIREGIGYDAGSSQKDFTSSKQLYVTSQSSGQKESSQAGITAGLVILIVLTSPIWLSLAAVLISLLIALCAVVFGLLCGILGIIVGCIGGGIVGIVHGISLVAFGNTAAGLIGIGASLIVTAFGILFLTPFVLLCGKGIPCMARGIGRGIRDLFKRKGR